MTFFRKVLFPGLAISTILSLIFSIFLGVFSALVGFDTSGAEGRYEDLILETLQGGADEFGGGNKLVDFLDNSIIDLEAINLGDGKGIRDLLITFGVKVIMPISVFVGIILGIVGFYKMMFATSDEENAKAYNYIIYGVAGIVIMISAGFIVNSLVGNTGDGVSSALGTDGSLLEFDTRNEINGTELAAELYSKILYPFIKLGLSFAMGILFIIVLINSFKYIFRPEDNSNAIQMLLYSGLGILVLLLSKSLVEVVYGTYDDVVIDIGTNNPDPGKLGDIGKIGGAIGVEGGSDAMLQIWSVINWILGLSSFIVMVILIYLGYLLLLRPNDEETLGRIKRYFIYMIVGIFMIGGSYLLAKILIVTGTTA